LKYCKPQLANCSGLPVDASNEEIEDIRHHFHDIQELDIKVMFHRLRKEKCPMMREHLKNAIEKEFAERDRTDRLFREVWWVTHHDRDIVDSEEMKEEHYPCVKASMGLYEEHCHVHSSFGLKYVRPVAHLCSKHKFHHIAEAIREVCRDPREEERRFYHHLDVHELEIMVLHKRMDDAECPVVREQYRDALEKEIASRDRIDRKFFEVMHKLLGEKLDVLELAPEKPKEENYPCMKASIDDFEETCWVPAAHGLQYTRAFSALCHHGYTFEKIHPAVHEVCGRHREE